MTLKNVNFWREPAYQIQIKKLTKNFDGDEIWLSLSDLVDCHARDVGFGLEGDGADGPVVRVDVVDAMTPAAPNVTCGCWATWNYVTNGIIMFIASFANKTKKMEQNNCFFKA